MYTIKTKKHKANGAAKRRMLQETPRRPPRRPPGRPGKPRETPRRPRKPQQAQGGPREALRKPSGKPPRGGGLGRAGSTLKHSIWESKGRIVKARHLGAQGGAFVGQIRYKNQVAGSGRAGSGRQSSPNKGVVAPSSCILMRFRADLWRFVEMLWRFVEMLLRFC